MKHEVCLTPNHLRAQREAQTNNNLIKIHTATSHRAIQLSKKQQTSHNLQYFSSN